MSRTSKFIDYSNQKIGKLNVLEYLGNSRWLVRCDCGHEFKIYSQSIRKQNQKRCKYCFYEDKKIHGGAGTPEYQAWKHMKERCYDIYNRMYENYGGRGIKICDRWLGENGFSNFLSDVGVRPTKGHSIDRIDVNKDYEPSNCKWSTKREQMLNRTNTVYLTHNGDRKTIIEWSELVGLSALVIRCRINKGWPIDVALFTPKIKSGYTRKTINKA